MPERAWIGCGKGGRIGGLGRGATQLEGLGELRVLWGIRGGIPHYLRVLRGWRGGVGGGGVGVTLG